MLVGIIATISLTGCKTLQLSPHPIPVEFDNQAVQSNDTLPPTPKNSRNQESNYLLENWF